MDALEATLFVAVKGKFVAVSAEYVLPSVLA
jgi:hypothetical protein